MHLSICSYAEKCCKHYFICAVHNVFLTLRTAKIYYLIYKHCSYASKQERFLFFFRTIDTCGKIGKTCQEGKKNKKKRIKFICSGGFSARTFTAYMHGNPRTRFAKQADARLYT